jgi:hypothetical protein
MIGISWFRAGMFQIRKETWKGEELPEIWKAEVILVMLVVAVYIHKVFIIGGVWGASFATLLYPADGDGIPEVSRVETDLRGLVVHLRINIQVDSKS